MIERDFEIPNEQSEVSIEDIDEELLNTISAMFVDVVVLFKELEDGTKISKELSNELKENQMFKNLFKTIVCKISPNIFLKLD